MTIQTDDQYYNGFCDGKKLQREVDIEDEIKFLQRIDLMEANDELDMQEIIDRITILRNELKEKKQ